MLDSSLYPKWVRSEGVPVTLAKGLVPQWAPPQLLPLHQLAQDLILRGCRNECTLQSGEGEGTGHRFGLVGRRAGALGGTGRSLPGPLSRSTVLGSSASVEALEGRREDSLTGWGRGADGHSASNG